MIFLSILIFILAMSLQFFQTQITPLFFSRIAAVSFIYAGALTFNALDIQSIGSGISIYSGLFQVTYYSILFEAFIFIIGAIILLSWPLFFNISSLHSFTDVNVKDTTILGYAGAKDLLSVSSEKSVKGLSLVSLNTQSNSIKLISSPVNPLKVKDGKEFSIGLITSVTTSKEAREYSLIALFSSLGGSLLLSSGDLLSMYLSIELQSFGLYILASLYRESGSATSAGLKYFLLGGLSSCLILLGLALVYAFTGLTSFESLYSLVSVLSIGDRSLYGLSSLVNEVDPLAFETLMKTSDTLTLISSSETSFDSISQGLSLGLILIVAGFLFKIAGAPFHNWSPDVYDESPTNVTIWLTIMPKLAIILLLLELEMGISLNISQHLIEGQSGLFSNSYDNSFQLNTLNSGGLDSSYVLKNIFLLSSLLSLIIGTVVGLAQIRIKRLLAYSTISHIGFLLLALAVSTEQSTESLIFYLLQYTITNLNAFFILLAFGYSINSLVSSSSINSDISFIYNLKGQFLYNPILSLSLAISLFSMAGIPPLIGFFGKQSVLLSAIGSGYFFMSLVAIVVSVISASYYLRIIRDLHSDSEEKRISIGSLFKFNDDQRIGKDSSINRNIINNSNRSSPAARSARSGSSVLSLRALQALHPSGLESIGGSRISNTYLYLTNAHAFIIAGLTLSIVFYVLKPSILLNSAVLSTLSLFFV